MNLNALVAPIVASVNPQVVATYQQYKRTSTDTDGSRAAAYEYPVDVLVQKQPMTYRDLIQVQGLNLNGEKCSIYVDGNWKGVSRPRLRGGDLITLPCGDVWLVAQELEAWSDTAGWCKVACTLQLPPAA